ncbi:hypothetical protein [Streptomyces sp. NBC_01518]|uniref:hypothetical protein n=1 Tax=Streptomyces sp. NBC_01518 TaxID=2903891 RepID=UPI00386CB13A
MKQTMLDSGMARRKKEKQPPLGIPKGIVLLEAPDGWRHTILTEDGGMLCGRLNVAPHTAPQDARAAAEAVAKGLARDFHRTDVEVNWDPPQDPGSWNAQITIVVRNEFPSPDAGG